MLENVFGNTKETFYGQVFTGFPQWGCDCGRSNPLCAEECRECGKAKEAPGRRVHGEIGKSGIVTCHCCERDLFAYDLIQKWDGSRECPFCNSRDWTARR